MGRAPSKPSPKPQAHATLPPKPAAPAPALARGSSSRGSSSSGGSRPRGGGGGGGGGSGSGGEGGGERARVTADADLAWLRWLRTSGAGQFYGADTATPARRCPLPAPHVPPALPANVPLPYFESVCPPDPSHPFCAPYHPLPPLIPQNRFGVPVPRLAPKRPAPATAPCRSVVSDLFSWRFVQLWLMIIMSATSGINIASSYKTFALKQPNLNSEAFLALVGSIAALGGNAAGRFFWGFMSDKFGFRRCFLTLTALQASTMLGYRKLAERRLTFALGTQVMLFCMSGNFVMFPAHCFRTFGANGAAVYSFLFTAFGSAALLGPVLTKALLAKGGYALAYNVFAALSLLALLLGSLV